MSSVHGNHGSVLTDHDSTITDPTQTYDEILQDTKNALESLREERKQKLQKLATTMLRIQHSGPTYDATQDLALKAQLGTSINELREQIETYETLIRNMMESNPDVQNPESVGSIPSTSTQVVVQSKKSDKVTLDTSIPRFGPKKLAASAAGITVLESPLEFLERFHAQASNIHGPNFDKVCSRLLRLAVLDDDQQQRLARAIETTHETLNWNTCEQLFTDTLLTALEKEDQARKAILKGRRPGESYQKYAWRLERIVRIYKICESPTHSSLLKIMKITIPSVVMDTMNNRYAITNALLDINAEDVRIEITHAEDFYKFLEKMTGPDDCEERKRIRASIPEDPPEASPPIKKQKTNVNTGDDAPNQRQPTLKHSMSVSMAVVATPRMTLLDVGYVAIASREAITPTNVPRAKPRPVLRLPVTCLLMATPIEVDSEMLPVEVTNVTIIRRLLGDRSRQQVPIPLSLLSKVNTHRLRWMTRT